jgi:GDP-L-fucose synthase
VLQKDAKIYIAGHVGLVGSAIVRKLSDLGFTDLVYRTHGELDLTRQKEVEDFFADVRPAYVFLAAAKVGGILANSMFPAQFIYRNLAIQTNVIHAAYLFKTKKLLFLGSSCIYPRLCPQPIKEEYLLDGKLEPTNEPYAVAKIAGIKMCQAYNKEHGTRFISIMPTNLYGPGDNFDLQNAHVIPALIHKFHEATKEMREKVVIWGSGTPRREFLHVDDLADACVFLMSHYDDSEIINIGSGTDITIRDLACLIRNIVGFQGELIFDTGKPDGTPRKLLDVSGIKKLGWKPKIDLKEGITQTYEWYKRSLQQ